MAIVTDYKFRLTTQFYKLFVCFLRSLPSLHCYTEATLSHTHPGRCTVRFHTWEHMSLCPGGAPSVWLVSLESFCFSIPGHSESTHFFYLLVDTSISLSTPLSTSITAIAWKHTKDINAEDVPSLWRLKEEDKYWYFGDISKSLIQPITGVSGLTLKY